MDGHVGGLFDGQAGSSNVSRLQSPDQARTVAASLGGQFRQVLLRVVEESEVPDPSRRRLLRGR